MTIEIDSAALQFALHAVRRAQDEDTGRTMIDPMATRAAAELERLISMRRDMPCMCPDRVVLSSAQIGNFVHGRCACGGSFTVAADVVQDLPFGRGSRSKPCGLPVDGGTCSLPLGHIWHTQDGGCRRG